MLDSVIEDTLSPFDTLPDSKLFMGQRYQESRVRFLTIPLYLIVVVFFANVMNLLCNVMCVGVPVTVECISILDFLKMLNCFCVSTTGEVALCGQRNSASDH